MAYGNIFHALGLHLYQPPGNLLTLLNNNEGEAQQIIRCYDRITRYAHKHPENAKLHLCFSGTLLEQLRTPEVVDRCRHFMDIPAMLDSFRVAKNIEFLGSGYHHPILPLIPTEDWEEQLTTERQLIEETFGRPPKGFYPAEMAFTMRMIPALVKAGYEYVVIEAAYVHPNGENLDPFQTYRAHYNEASIAVISKDHSASQAQANGMEVYWFANEISHRSQSSPRPEGVRLLTTWSDGENDAWFRQDDQEGFFGKFFEPYMAHVRSRRYPIKPAFISEFIQNHPTPYSAQVETCKWSPEENLGYELPQWQGSDAQRQALTKIQEASRRYYQLLKRNNLSSDMMTSLKKAHRLVLESESSYFLYGGEPQIAKLFEKLTTAEKLLAEVESATQAAEKPVATAKPADKAEVKPAEVKPVEVEPVAKAIEKPAVTPTTPAQKPAATADKTEVKPPEVKPVAATAVKEASPVKSDSSVVTAATPEKELSPPKTVTATNATATPSSNTNKGAPTSFGKKK